MPPLSLMIKPVSGRCNLRCSYCFYRDEMENRAQPLFERMNEKTLDALLRRVFSYADGFVSFTFQGGEPTLAGEAFFRAFLTLEKKYNTRRIPVRYALQTNGVSLSDSLCRLFAENHFLCGVSLDGTQALHDEMRLDPSGAPTFSRALDGARRLLSHGAQVNILTVVDARLAASPEAVMDSLSPFPHLQFIPRLDALGCAPQPHALTGPLWGEFLCAIFARYRAAYDRFAPISIREFDNYIAALLGLPPESCAQQGRCSLGYVVEGDGSVYPCDFYALDEWKMGNVHTDNFLRLTSSPAARAFLSRPSASPVPRAECRACPGFALCRGGCPRERESLPDGALSPVCLGRQLFFNRHLKDLEKMAREEMRRRRR